MENYNTESFNREFVTKSNLVRLLGKSPSYLNYYVDTLPEPIIVPNGNSKGIWFYHVDALCNNTKNINLKSQFIALFSGEQQ